MSRPLLIVAAVIVLAGAFPKEAMLVITWSSQTLGSIAGMVSPGQQTTIVIAVAILALAGISGRG